MNCTPLTESLFYILLSVKKPNYGYGIMEQIREMTEGRINMGAGTLYGAINTLLEKGYIVLYHQQTDSRKKKEYVITERGMEALKVEMGRLQQMIINGKKVLE